MTTGPLTAVARLMLIAGLVFTSSLFTGNVRADDDLMSQLAAAETSLTQTDDANTDDANIDEDDMGMADVESLINDGEEELDENEAVAACYRRFGRSFGFGRSYGFRSYGYNRGYSRSYYRPSCYRSYSYLSPSYCYSPVSYSYCTPTYSSYWGCW